PLAALVNPRKPLLSSGPRRSLGFQASRVGRGSDEGKGRERCDSEGEAAMASTKVQRIMTQPIKARIQIWLFEQKDLRIEGRIIGFDEYMNLVLEEAEELNVKKKTRKPLGRILLKGDNITLMMNTGK
ncbi:Small nuclear ribonucleoprotein E, partial [Musa troglodytarum]